eukprot:3962337-Pyramimonas_sp.AAC.1
MSYYHNGPKWLKRIRAGLSTPKVDTPGIPSGTNIQGQCQRLYAAALIYCAWLRRAAKSMF